MTTKQVESTSQDMEELSHGSLAVNCSSGKNKRKSSSNQEKASYYEEETDTEEEFTIIIANEEQEDHRRQQQKERRLLGFWEITFVLTAVFSTGNIIMIPWAIGQLGYIVGPVTLILWAIAAFYFNCFLMDIALKENCRSLGDVGYHLMGKSGKILFEIFQTANNFLYMPVALETCAFSLQYLFDFTGFHCIGHWKVITFVALFVALQFVKTWRHIAWAAYLTVMISAFKGYILLPYSYFAYKDEIQNSEQYLGPALPAGNPQNTWHDLGMAVSGISFSLTPIEILIEVIGDAKDRSRSNCRKSLAVSFVWTASFYLVSGLTCIHFWGWNLLDPVTLEIPHDSWVGPLLSTLVLINVFVDYIVGAKITNDNLLGYLFPKKWKNDDNDGNILSENTTNNSNKKNAGKRDWLVHLILSLPTSAASLGFTLFIPDFATLVGFVSALTVIGINTWGPALGYFVGGMKYASNPWLMATGLLVGIAYMIWAVAAAIYEIVTADFTSGNFYCDGS